MTYVVEGISNHLEPDNQVRRIGEFQSSAEAVTAAHAAIEAFLIQECKPGMDAKALFSLYRTRGEHPFIFRDDDTTFNVPGFNHTLYAMTRAGEICAGQK